MNTWQLQEAKAQFSKIVKESLEHGPQEITLRGEPAVIIISKKEYDKLIKPKPSLVDFIKKSPLAGLNIEFPRDQSLTREVDL